MKIQKFCFPTAIAACLSIFVLSADAGPREDIIRLTHGLEKAAASLRQEFRTHYRGTYQFQPMMACLRQVEKSASHIHSLSHESVGEARHLRKDVTDLDKTVHDLHELVDRVEKGKSGRNVKGKTNHVHRDLDAMNKSLHALRDLATVRIQRQNQRQRQQGPPANQYGYRSQQPAPVTRRPSPVTRYQQPPASSSSYRNNYRPSSTSNYPYRQNYNSGNSGSNPQGAEILRSLLQLLNNGGGR